MVKFDKPRLIMRNLQRLQEEIREHFVHFFGFHAHD